MEFTHKLSQKIDKEPIYVDALERFAPLMSLLSKKLRRQFLSILINKTLVEMRIGGDERDIARRARSVTTATDIGLHCSQMFGAANFLELSKWLVRRLSQCGVP